MLLFLVRPTLIHVKTQEAVLESSPALGCQPGGASV